MKGMSTTMEENGLAIFFANLGTQNNTEPLQKASCQNLCNNGIKWVSNFLGKSGNPKTNTGPLQILE